MDNVIVSCLVIGLAFYFSIPLEVFACGTEYQFSPPVVDVNTEVVVIDEFQMRFVDAEDVVFLNSTVSGDGVGQQNRFFTGLDGVGSLLLAIPLASCHRVKSLFIDGDGGGCLSSTPHIVLQFGFHRQDSATFLAEVAGQGNDVCGRI